MGEEELERSEVEAVLETRRELGPSYDAALVDSFADRIERAVEKRTADVLSSRDLRRHHADSGGKRQPSTSSRRWPPCRSPSRSASWTGRWP
jgi:hypothetical protein